MPATKQSLAKLANDALTRIQTRDDEERSGSTRAGITPALNAAIAKIEFELNKTANRGLFTASVDVVFGNEAHIPAILEHFGDIDPKLESKGANGRKALTFNWSK